jgi:ABC-type bacteriocin/lantibiotic exporter with double-glycine peptidase domain
MKNRGELTWLLRRFKPLWHLQLLGYTLTCTSSLLSLADPLVMKWLFDVVLPSHSPRLLPLVALALVALYAGRAVSNSAGGLLTFRTITCLSAKIRLALVEKLARQGVAYHDTVAVGELLCRVETDVEQISKLSVEAITDLIRVMSLGLTGIAVMFYLNARLTSLVLPLLPLFVWVTACFRRPLKDRSDKAQQVRGKISAFLQELFANILQVQLLSREEAEANRFSALLNESVENEMKRRRLELIFSAVVCLVIVAGGATVLSYGGYLVITGSLSTGGLVAFYGYIMLLFGSFYGIGETYAKFQRIYASVRRLQEVEDARSTLPEKSDAVRLNIQNGCDIELCDLGFSYPGAPKVIDDVSLHIWSGERVAILGDNGSGKSTLAKLMARVYDADSGRVIVGGFDVRDLELKSLRRVVAYVAPEPMLRNASLLENLLDGSPQADWKEVREIARLTRLDEVVARQPLEWDEPLGPRTRLSSGERQRLALARALLLRPYVLLLDECLSAVDETTERLILEDLRNMRRRTTIILISHRGRTTDWADRKIIMRSEQLLSAPYSEVGASLIA